jgi:hypothetical protein
VGKAKNSQRGFGVIEIVIILVVLGVIGFLAWRLYSFSTAPKDSQGRTFVEWSWDGENWKPMGTAPDCKSPLTVESPADTGKITNVLMPGQVRGSDFKPHGGLSSDSPANNSLVVATVRDAYLYRGAQYIAEDMGQTAVQYMFDFMDSCGIMFRFDHLATLTDQFKAYDKQMPVPQLNDSRTTVFNDHPFIPKGTVVATEIGIKPTKNSFFDFGVYDLRQRNEASKTDLYKTDQLRISDKEQSFYAVCWFDLLPTAQKAIVKGLPQRGGEAQGGSDYCN